MPTYATRYPCPMADRTRAGKIDASAPVDADAARAVLVATADASMGDVKTTVDAQLDDRQKVGAREDAYVRIADILAHLHGVLDCNLISIVRNPDDTFTLTTDRPIRVDHVKLWDLVETKGG